MSSRLPLRMSLLNSSGVKGRLGSSSIGRRNRGPKNRRTRLASRRMSTPSRQQQTSQSAYCSSRILEIARGRTESAPKISAREYSPLLRTNRQNRHSVHTPDCAPNPGEPRSRQSRHRDSRHAGHDDLVLWNLATMPERMMPCGAFLKPCTLRRDCTGVSNSISLPPARFIPQHRTAPPVADAARKIYANPQARPRTL